MKIVNLNDIKVALYHFENEEENKYAQRIKFDENALKVLAYDYMVYASECPHFEGEKVPSLESFVKGHVAQKAVTENWLHDLLDGESK